jgi:hypothetical protein
MNCAVLPQVEQPDKLAMYRDKAHRELDKFIDRLAPKLLQEDPLTLQEISDAFQENKGEMLGGLLEEFIRTHLLEKHQQTRCDCPECGKLVYKKRDASRRIDTRQGSSLVERPYFYCPDCNKGFSPVDEALALASRKKQYDLQQLALKYLAEMPFEKAGELFEEATGVPFSDNRLHNLFAEFTDQMTIEDVIPTAEEIERRINSLTRTGNHRPILAVASDGAHMPTRPASNRKGKRGPGEYREAKGFRIYAIGKDDIVQIASWHQIQNADEFARDLNITAARIPQDKVRICLLGDGASWVWRCMEEAFPGSRQILDYYHCMEHLHAVADAQYGDDPDKALSWVIGAIGHIYYDETGQVIGGLRRMKPKNDTVKEQIRQLIGYLQNNRQRTNYGGARKGGYPIGSGGIESANKFICHTRLKRSGAWWLKPYGNGMLRLRCALVNGTFSEAFAKYVTRDQAKKYLRTNS